MDRNAYEAVHDGYRRRQGERRLVYNGHHGTAPEQELLPHGCLVSRQRYGRIPGSGCHGPLLCHRPGRKLAAITADNLTETEYNAITKKNGNTFEKFRNVSITQNGKVAAGEWIDVIRFRDWLQEEIRTNEFYLLINSDKVPYTDVGIAMVETVLRKALEDGQAAGGIAPTEYDEDGNKNLGYTIDVPLSSSITANQKASRVLKDVKFTARLAGAIHAIKINGSFTYDNLLESA